MSEQEFFGEGGRLSGEKPLPPFLAGYFLISGIQLLDPNFFRTVVLMVQHGDDGAFGLVVNRPSERNLGAVLPDIGGGDALDIPVYIGGPVQQDYLFVLHSGLPDTVQSGMAVKPVPGVIFEPATKDLVRFLAEEWAALPGEDRPKIRLYAGYSGWAPGQLERELREHSWFTHLAQENIVFHPDPETAWKAALSEKGGYFKFVAETGNMPSIN
jgi:putative transcriptional regulator